MDGKTKTDREFLIAIIGAGSDPHYMRYSSSLGIIKTPVIVIERLLEKPLELELAEILEKIPILPFPPEILDRQFKFSHHDAPKMRHDRSTIKNYDNKLRAKSKRLQNKKGR